MRNVFLYSYIIPIVAVVACLVTRLWYFGKYIDEWDSVNFAFGLSKGYDILHDQPHFPGYPVYMFFSWIWYKIIGSDIQALVFSGVLFSSLAVFPLYELSRRMFSRGVAILTVILYIINPQIWLQAEKPLSDAFGLFFVITAILFFSMAIEYAYGMPLSLLHKRDGESFPQSPFSEGKGNEGKVLGENAKCRASLKYLAWGGAMLGLGLGVRVTYLALIPIMAYTAYVISQRIDSKKRIVIWGGSGLSVGIVAWLGYLLVRFTPYQCYKKFFSHADYHFYKEGNSIITTSDYGERFFDIFHNLSAHSLGTWWTDTSRLRILPTLIIVAAFAAFFLYEKWNLRNKFLLAFFIPYFLWVAFIQDAIRQIMVLVPFLAIIIGAGLLHVSCSLRGKKLGIPVFYAVVSVFFAAQAADSCKIVSMNKNEEPPSVSTIKYITENYDKSDTKFYCINDWRLFQYYAPEWCDKKNSHVYFVSRMSGVIKDLDRLKKKPKHILISSKLFERYKYKDKLIKLAEFKRNRYGVADYNWLVLYSFQWR